MNARTYLLQLRDLREDIERIKLEIKRIEMKMTSPGTVRYDRVRVQSTQENVMESALDKKEQMCRQLKQMLNRYQKQYTKIMREINGLENRTHRTILKLYYLDGISVKKIADRLHYSEDWTFHLLTRARRDFAQKYL